MKILQIITKSETGGAQTIVRMLASELHSRWHKVAVAAGAEGSWMAFQGMDSQVERFEIENLVRNINPLDDFKAMLEIEKVYRYWKPDIVHLHTSKAAALGRMAAGIDRKRIVYTMHGFDQIRVSHHRYLAVDKALRSRCGAIVAVSNVDLEAMRSEGYDPILIPNGTPDSRLIRVSEPDLADRLTKIKNDGLPLAIMIARDAAPKRIDIAREAARQLVGKVNIAWIGGEKKPEDPGNFFALGQHADAAAYLRYADLFLLLSDHEGLSLSLLEAFSAGLPCVASAIDGCLEALDQDGVGEGKFGIAVSNSIESVAEALLSLAASNSLKKRMGAAARMHWDGQYSGRAMVDAYEALYKNLMEF